MLKSVVLHASVCLCSGAAQQRQQQPSMAHVVHARTRAAVVQGKGRLQLLQPAATRVQELHPDPSIHAFVLAVCFTSLANYAGWHKKIMPYGGVHLNQCCSLGHVWYVWH